MDLRAATRKTIVESANLHEPGQLPNIGLPGANAPYWHVILTTKTGLLPPRIQILIFESREVAENCIAAHPPGAEVKWDKVSSDSETKLRAWLESSMDNYRANSHLGAGGHDDGYLSWRVLTDAGIIGGPQPSSDVFDYLGADRIETLKSLHGENWSAAAEFEFCWLTLPHSSPVFLAAAHNFHTYITGDDFSAGYLLRDLENLVHGIEGEAAKAIEMRKKAGRKGSVASANARSQRVASLLENMEAVASRNPDIVKLGVRSLAALAVSESAAASPQLWSQGAGQTEEYLGEIRRGEAGEEMKARYLALFPR